MKVSVVKVTQAEAEYKRQSALINKEEIKIVVPVTEATPESAVQKEDMKSWLNSPDSIRTIKLKREQTQEIRKEVELNTPQKTQRN